MSTDNQVVDMVHHVQVPAEVADGVRTAIEPALKEVAALCAENVRLSNEKWLIERVANTLALENRVLTERVAELEGALVWSLDYIADGLEAPRHDCEYYTNPLKGACDFCEQYWSSRTLVSEEKP